MAAPTPRFCWDNALFKAATVITPSSQLAAQPASSLKYTLRSKTWRSALGWTVYTGFNTKIDVRENVTDRVATIATGTYPTGALYAAAVQTALNAMGGTNTYTCSYDTGTFKFTIARATGADSVTLKWSTGANASASAGKDLGFVTTADDSGLTTYTGDSAAYQSRHFLDINTGAEVADIDIVKDENDRLDYSEGGSAKAARITAGHYSTHAALATAVAAAMNAVAATNTYSCDWDSVADQKFRIFRTAGAATISLLWSTGANAADSIGSTLGYTVTSDDTGATSYTADNATYGWPYGQVAIVSDHNLRFQGTLTIKGQVGVGGPVVNDQDLPGNDALRLSFRGADSVAPQYWRLLIEDVQNTDGFNELRLYIGPYIEPSRGIDQGSEEAEVPLDVALVSDHGAVLGDDRPDPWTLEARMSYLTAADKTLLVTMQRTVGTVRPFWYIEDPVADPRGTAHHVVLAQGFRFARMSGISPTRHFTTPLSLREDMP